jgi:hypothetical protein
MRTTHTFVLRLLVDTDEPYQLRGALHSVVDDANHPFADVQALLDLLRRMASDALSSETDFNLKGGNDEQDD